ncbi:hypothetical protein [Roseomonas genomospecies 6]|uniref:hypothetical protein n=1 Tax=Roseomonas genomospecies 6 TaxID=214106 RepID=UPI0011F24507|nr:hypothetical protein [Roseomonas genomospecies 6]
MLRAVLLCVALLTLVAPGTARAEEGCPSRTFPDPHEKNCAAVSSYNRLPLDDRQPMRFQAIQVSMVIIYIQGTGAITKDTPDELRRFLKTHDGQMSKSLYLHSGGGDLMAGLELGQVIREAGLNTGIGRSIALDGLMKIHDYKQAHCLSACAYAFLGGVTRSFGEMDVYGIHRFGRTQGTVSGADAQVVSGIVAKYIQSMGVDVSVFQLASLASFEKEMFRVPVDLAKRMRIIFDGSGQTIFRIEDRDGLVVAAFRITKREREYDGVVTCSGGERLLVLVDRTNTVRPPMRTMMGFPAEFHADGGRVLQGTATYVPPSAPNRAPVVVFRLPDMDEQAFAGEGMSLHHIENPHLRPLRKDGSPTLDDAFMERVVWADAVTDFAFSIAADNAARTLPIVFRECGRQGVGRK